MGTPYEGLRQMNDISGFATAQNVVLPNDDLDLQLVWLYAMEQNGPYAINAAMLGEHWISLIVPHWNEYGLGKSNMKRGLPPPMSGDYENNWKNSNGAWIRTEIWACVAPGVPALAAKMAMEDAAVDHGAGEGTFAAAFVAALQSSAFVIGDLRRCIEIGLEAIPAESRMAKSIVFVLDCYDKGMTYKEARNAVFELNSDIGDGWFEAPTNVSYAVIGLLWGEGDFKKSMIYAINCGDDTDCTGATVGSTFGILHGTAGIPEDWSGYIGDDIVTVSINKGNNGKEVPKTCTELTDRVVAIAPFVLYSGNTALSNRFTVKDPRSAYKMELTPGESDIPENVYELLAAGVTEKTKPVTEALRPYTMHFENVMMKVQVTLDSAPEIAPEGEISGNLYFSSKFTFEDAPLNLKLRWILPEGFTAKSRLTAMLPGFDPHNQGKYTVPFTLKAGECVEPENRIVLEIMPVGRHTPLYVSFPLLG